MRIHSNVKNQKEMRNNIVYLLLAYLLLTASVSGFAASLTADADSAYNSKDYAKAVELYTEVVETEGSNPQLLYNLGNAYYQSGDYGRAMLNYERARRLDPSLKELNANISYLKSRVEDSNKAEQKGRRLKVTPDEPSFFQSVRTAVAVDISGNVWAVWGAVMFVLAVGCAAVYIFTRNVIARKIGFFGGGIALLLSIVFVFFAFMGARAYHSSGEGVLLPLKTVLQTEAGKAGNDEKGAVLTKGTIVQILSEENDADGTVRWYKVRLNSDYIGWVPAESLEAI